MAISITLAMNRDKASRINASDPPAVREDRDTDELKDPKRKKRD
ncbi:MAG TPA: hypothetical protein VK993_02140 [Chthoniobacterales bacterium]|nr:hypothetical protein [Chthoniobacterales bacterium]